MKTIKACKTVWLKMLDTLIDKSIKFYQKKVHCQDWNFWFLDNNQWRLEIRQNSILNTYYVTAFSMWREFWEWILLELWESFWAFKCSFSLLPRITTWLSNENIVILKLGWRVWDFREVCILIFMSELHA
jgi:hypothetical protein